MNIDRIQKYFFASPSDQIQMVWWGDCINLTFFFASVFTVPGTRLANGKLKNENWSFSNWPQIWIILMFFQNKKNVKWKSLFPIRRDENGIQAWKIDKKHSIFIMTGTMVEKLQIFYESMHSGQRVLKLLKI